MTRKAIAFLCALSLLIIAGCSSAKPAETPKAPEAPKAPEPVTITFWHTYNSDSPENKTLNEVVIPAFQKKNSNITVKAVVMPYDGLHDSMTVAAAGGTTPDLLRMDIIWTPEFSKLGVLEPLDNYPGFADVKASIAFPAPLATNFYKGKYNGLPLDTNTQVMVYNPEALKTAGLSAPPKTVDEFKKYMASATGNNKKWALGLDGPYPWQILPFFWSMGGKVTNDDYTKATGFVNSDDSVAAVQTLLDLFKAGSFGPELLGGQPGTWDGYKAGNYGAVLQGPWFYSALGKELNGKMVSGLIPAGKGGSISVIGGENIAMFKTSPQNKKDAAWKFIQFMLSDEAQVAMAKTGQMPVTKSASTNPVMKEAGYYDVYIEQLKTAMPRTPVPTYTKIDSVLQNAVESVLRGKAAPKAAMDQAAKEIDALLAQ